jgi:hypothetical protein
MVGLVVACILFSAAIQFSIAMELPYQTAPRAWNGQALTALLFERRHGVASTKDVLSRSRISGTTVPSPTAAVPRTETVQQTLHDALVLLGVVVVSETGESDAV